MNKFIKKADILLVLLLLVICAALLIPKYIDKSQVKAVIYKDGKVVKEIDLSAVDEPYELDLESTPKAKLKVENGSIRYSYAECHDKLCINSGELSKPGDTAACLPSKTLVVIEGEKGSEAPDVITY